MPRELRGVTKREAQLKMPKRYFVIASEGADTERIYFEHLGTKLNSVLLKVVKIEFLERVGDERSKSSHSNVVSQLDLYKKKYQIDAKSDELWVVIDRDKQNNPEKNIASIAAKCIQKKYKLALSNPNFEFWLLLHLADITELEDDEISDIYNCVKVSKKNIIEKKLSELLGGYDKSNYNISKVLEGLHLAIGRAKVIDRDSKTRWIEHDIGSRVYQLIENIFSFTIDSNDNLESIIS